MDSESSPAPQNNSELAQPNDIEQNHIDDSERQESPCGSLDQTTVLKPPESPPTEETTPQPSGCGSFASSVLKFLSENIGTIVKGLIAGLGGAGVILAWVQKAFNPWSPHNVSVFWLAIFFGTSGGIIAIVSTWTLVRQYRAKRTPGTTWIGVFQNPGWLLVALFSVMAITSCLIVWPRIRDSWQHRHGGFDVVGIVITQDLVFPTADSKEYKEHQRFLHKMEVIMAEMEDRSARSGLPLRVEWDRDLTPPKGTTVNLTSLQRFRRNEGLSALLWIDYEMDPSAAVITRIKLQTLDDVLSGNPKGVRLGGETEWELALNSGEIDDLARDIWDALLGYVALMHYAQEEYQESINYLSSMSVLARSSSRTKSRILFEEPFLFYALIDMSYETEQFDWVASSGRMLTPKGHEMAGSIEELGLQALENLLSSGTVDNAVHPFLELLVCEIHVRLGHVGSQFATEDRLRYIIEQAKVGTIESLAYPDESARKRLMAQAEVWLTRAYSLRGEISQVKPLLDQAIKDDEDYWLPYFELGRYYLAQGEHAAAVEALQNARDLDPANKVLVQKWYGMAQYLGGDIDSARDSWNDAEERGQERIQEVVHFFQPPNVVFIDPSASISELPVRIFIAPAAGAKTTATGAIPAISPTTVIHTPPAITTATITYTTSVTQTQPPADVMIGAYTVVLRQGGITGEELERRTIRPNPHTQTYAPVTFDLSLLLGRCHISCEAGCPEIRGLYVLALYDEQSGDVKELPIKAHPFVVSASSLMKLAVTLEGTPLPDGEIQGVYGKPILVKAEIVGDFQGKRYELADTHALERLKVYLEVFNIEGRLVTRLPLAPSVDAYQRDISYKSEFKPPGANTFHVYGVVSDTLTSEIVLQSKPIILRIVMPTSTPTPTPTPSPTPEPTATFTPSPTPTPTPPVITVVWIKADGVPAYAGPNTDHELYQLKRCQLFIERHRTEVGKAELQWLAPGLNTTWASVEDFEKWQSMPRHDFEKLDALATCRHDNVLYAIQRGSDQVLPLGECYSQCAVFEVLAQEEGLILVRGQMGQVRVEGWIKAEDMDVYELKELDLDWSD